jgi:hypothetical protein
MSAIDLHRDANAANIDPVWLGCSCEECNKKFRDIAQTGIYFEELGMKDGEVTRTRVDPEEYLNEKPLPDEFIDKLVKVNNIYAKEVWNKAIEAAANSLQKAPVFTKQDFGSLTDAQSIVILSVCERQIRTLKK